MNSRPLAPSDAAAIAELWLAGAAESAAFNSTFRPRVSVAEYGASVAEELRSGSCTGWGVFNADNILLGYLTARIAQPSVEFEQAPYLYLLDLDVRATSRRHGIGTKLVEIARAYASERGLSIVEVSWLSDDPRASAFWRAQRFVPYLVRAQLAAQTPVGSTPNDALYLPVDRHAK